MAATVVAQGAAQIAEMVVLEVGGKSNDFPHFSA